MASAISISIAVVAWAASILFCGRYLDAAVLEFVEPSQSLTLRLEAKALLETGWWPINETNNISSPCKWPHGITCNAGGSVIKIDRASVRLGNNSDESKGKLEVLNSSSLPNLISLNLNFTQLQGKIPLEIGALSKITHLDLSSNNLVGELPHSLANLTQLVRLEISLNHIFGQIPPHLWLLSNLTYIDMCQNQITGPISLNHIFGQIPPWAYQILVSREFATNGAAASHMPPGLPDE